MSLKSITRTSSVCWSPRSNCWWRTWIGWCALIACADVRGLAERMCQLEMGIYAVFWNDIWERANATSKIIQDPNLDLNSAVAAVKALKTLIELKRDCFEDYEKEGSVKSGSTEYVQRRQRRRNVRLDSLDQPRHTGDTSDQFELSQSEKFRIDNCLPVIDQFSTSLEHRRRAYQLISSRFGCLRQLDVLSSQEILTAASTLVEVYNEYLDVCLGNELVQCTVCWVCECLQRWTRRKCLEREFHVPVDIEEASSDFRVHILMWR